LKRLPGADRGTPLDFARDKLLVLSYNLKLVQKRSLFVLKRLLGADRGTPLDFARDKLLVLSYNLKLVQKKTSSF